MSNRKLLKVTLHQAIHVLGLGSLTTNIDPTINKMYGGTEITKTEGGVTLKSKDKLGKPIEAFIPDGNVAVAQFDLNEANS